MKTDTFEIRLFTANDSYEPHMDWISKDRLADMKFVDYYVNGESLEYILFNIEKQYYDKPVSKNALPQFGHNNTRKMEFDFDDCLTPGTYSYNEFELYCCDGCGEPGCWSVCCVIREEDGFIVMKDFHHNHRDWKYDLEFHFTKENFFSEISKL